MTLDELRRLNKQQLLALADAQLALAEPVSTSASELPAIPDVELLSNILTVLRERKRAERVADTLASKMKAADLPHIPWLEDATYVASHIQSDEPGKHYVYAILLSGYATSGGCGIYVGESSHPPEQRYWEHRRGQNAAHRLPKRGRGLLPSLYGHLNPLSKREAIMLEPVLAAALKTIEWEGRPLKVRYGRRKNAGAKSGSKSA